MNESTLIVKVGGGASINLAGIASDLGEIVSRGERVVVVHGANACRDDLADRLGAPTRTITSASGVSSVLTDQVALDVLTMAYAGLANKRFVSQCQQQDVQAIGLSGLDGASVRARRNPGIRVLENGRKRVVRDHSGKPTEVNVGLLELLLGNGYVPVLTVPIIDESGFAVNTENDSIVALLQQTLGARRVVQLLEAPGLLQDAADPLSLIGRLDFGGLERLAERATGRIQRKLMALARMAKGDCEQILLADGRTDHPLRRALSGQGTTIQ